MKSLTTPDFWRSYAALSTEVKEQARKAYRLCISKKWEMICGQSGLVVDIVH